MSLHVQEGYWNGFRRYIFNQLNVILRAMTALAQELTMAKNMHIYILDSGSFYNS